ncbi:MAG: hypothetical protein EOM67_11725, partial [Spirochaetia bacterium]|nr:hypothetical protein [Spirochaetia bacterium]
MKKALYFFIYIIFTFPLGAESVELYAFTDIMALKSVMPQQIYGAIGFGATLNEDIAIEIPVKFLIDSTGGDEAILDTSVHLLIYPWEKGPYISLSLIQLITFIGSFTPQEPFHYLNEISIGYRWNFFNILSISPKITIR